MLYNNKKTLSALALILAMSVSLAGNSYAQGVVSLVDDGVDELGIQNIDEPTAPFDEAKGLEAGDMQPINIDAPAIDETFPPEINQTIENPVEGLPMDDAAIVDFPAPEDAPIPSVNTSFDIPLEGENVEVAVPNVTVEESVAPSFDDAPIELPVENGLPVNDKKNFNAPHRPIIPDFNGKPMRNRPDMPNRPNMPNMNGRQPGAFNEVKGLLPKDADLAAKQAEKEAEMKNLPELGNSVLSQIDNELFSQMSDIEKQTTLLSLELRREKLKSEIAAIKAAREQAEQQAIEEKAAREQRKKDMQTEKEIEKIREQQLLEDKKIALEALRQEKALNDYRNKMLENEQKWINENQKLYNKMQQMEEERKAIISSFADRLDALKQESQSVISAASIAKQNHDKAVENLMAQNVQLQKRLDAETSMGKNPFGDADANGQINESSLNKDYVIMEIRGKGEDLIAKLINKNGESFLVKKGSVLQSGHKIEKITHNYITLDRKGIKDYLQFTAGGVLDKEPESSDLMSKAGNLKDAISGGGATTAPSRPPLLKENSIPSLSNGMFVK